MSSSNGLVSLELLDSIDDAILIIDQDNVVLYRNKSAEVLFKGRIDKGRGIGSFLLGQKVVELDVPQPDGSIITVEASVNETSWQESPAKVVIFRDVTERNETRARAENTNRCLRINRNVKKLILREKDPSKIGQEVCNYLVGELVCRRALIVISHHQGSHIIPASAGWNDEIASFIQNVSHGWAPPCSAHEPAPADEIKILDPRQSCLECPLSEYYDDYVAYSSQIRYKGALWGMLCATVSRRLEHDPDLTELLGDIGHDLSMMAHSIWLEEEHQRAYEKLWASEERYRDLYNEAPHACFTVCADDGTIKDCNIAAGRLLGMDVSELKGRHFFELYADTPLGKQRAREIFDIFREGDTISGVELQVERADGKVLDVSLSVQPKHDDEGRVIESRSTVVDITETKLLQEQLVQSQKMEAIGKLAGGIAHDFNNMLSVIHGYTSLIMSDVKKEDPVYMSAQEIEMAVRKATALVHQLLAFSRKSILEPTLVDLNEVIREMKSMLGRVLGEDIELSLRLDTELWKTRIDVNQLEQILMNLVVNSRDAMPRGGSLTVETANIDIQNNQVDKYFLSTPGRYSMLIVSDSGSGMDAETKARAFEPFFTTKGANQGTGLGLSTVYGIVKQSGGEIHIYSEPGNGTTFKIYLPVSDQGMARKRPSQRLAASVKGSETILVVEDENSLLNLIDKILLKNGYRVLKAENAGAALLVARDFDGPIHLMLTDVIMPRMSGHELAGWMNDNYSDMKIIYMSGYTESTVVLHGVLDGEVNFLHKPFTSEQILSKIRSVLDDN